MLNSCGILLQAVTASSDGSLCNKPVTNKCRHSHRSKLKINRTSRTSPVWWHSSGPTSQPSPMSSPSMIFASRRSATTTRLTCKTFHTTTQTLDSRQRFKAAGFNNIKNVVKLLEQVMFKVSLSLVAIFASEIEFSQKQHINPDYIEHDSLIQTFHLNISRKNEATGTKQELHLSVFPVHLKKCVD